MSVANVWCHPAIDIKVAHRHETPRTRHYQNPGIFKTPGGDLLISSGIDINNNSDAATEASGGSRLFRSEDNGVTWTYQDTSDAAWTLFAVGSDIYAFGIDVSTSVNDGSVVIRKSTDDGVTWGAATTLKTEDSSNHYVLVPPSPLVTGGRVYAVLANTPDVTLGYAHNAKMSLLHASTSADLTLLASWTESNNVQLSGDITTGMTHVGFWEPCLLLDRDSNAKIVLRVKADFVVNKAAVIDATLGASASLSYTPSTGVRDMNGAHVMFVTRYDSQSDKYIAIATRNTFGGGTFETYRQRTCLYLAYSDDLVTWEVGPDLIRAFHWEETYKARGEGIQYTDWIFDGDDIIGVIRHGEFPLAVDYHQATAVTFYRIKNYYQNLLAPAPTNSGTSPPGPAAVTRNGQAI